MDRRSILKSALAMGVAATPGAAPAIQQSALSSASKPNILFIMDDQHRGDCTRADGNTAIHTPNIDRIGAEGVRFRRAYSCTPTCTPARSALLTGLAPWNHGMLHMVAMGEHYPFTKPQALRDAGYYTAGIGKMHYHPQRTTHGYHQIVLDESGRIENPEFRSDYRAWFWSEAPTRNPDATGIGWNDYVAKPYALPENLHPTYWTGTTAVNFLANYNRPEPFFLKVSFARPHSPYDPPERLWNKYRDAPLPEPKIGDWAAKYAPRSSERDDLWHGDLGKAKVRESRRGYYGSVEFVDEQVGRILEALERRGWLEQTLIVFTSDHGDMTGDHHLWRKSYPYEASARIPMALRWPAGLISGERGQVRSETVELRDLLPTFLDAAGAPANRPLDGASLLGLLRGNGPAWREYLDLEHGVCYSLENNWTGLTDGRMKYIFHAYHGNEQLFDLTADPYEARDLSSSTAHEATLRLWRQRMVQHLEPRGDVWVKGGKLQIRREPIPRSPNFPVSKT